MNNNNLKNKNPYVGPKSFEEEDSEIFFGRETECQKLLDSLISNRILLFYSSSGAGKTSLIKASLIPKIKKEMDLFSTYPCIRIGLHPEQTDDDTNPYVSSVIKSLQSIDATKDSINIIGKAPITLSKYFSSLDEKEKSPESGEIINKLFIFDQFEEIFTIDPVDIKSKLEFFQQLGKALEPMHRWALIVMREEFIAHLDPFRNLIPYELKNTFRLELLSQESARKAIVEPASKKDFGFSDEAVEYLITELRKVRFLGPSGKVQEKPGPYVEPLLLQVACYNIWEKYKSTSKNIELEDISAKSGNVNKILSQFYEDCISIAAQKYQIEVSLIRKWFEEKLITSVRTRGLVLKQTNTSEFSNEVIAELEEKHLIRTEQHAGNIWYELIHDRFIEPILDSNIAWRSAQIVCSGKLEPWLCQKAYELSRERRLRQWANEPLDRFMTQHPSSDEDKKLDWINSCLLFTLFLFEKQMILKLNDDNDIYKILSERWLTEVQRFKAYFLWEKDGAKYPTDRDRYYKSAGEEIRELLIKPSVKEPVKNFKHVRNFITENFLDKEGKLDQSKENVTALVRQKAFHLYAMTGNNDDKYNYSQAWEYTTLFYENIIPAIQDGQEDRVKNVMHAFGFDSTHENHPYYYIIDCLELLMAIYYLPANMIKNLWDKNPGSKERTL